MSNAKKKTTKKPAKQKKSKSSEKKVGSALPGNVKVGKPSGVKTKPLVQKTVEEQFDALRKTLEATNKGGPKQARALVQALEALDNAKLAADRHIRHNI